MTLSEAKTILTQLDQLEFELPNGDLVPRHFHVTEVGQVTKHFIDCGGTVRHEEVVNFQLWAADDDDHRLHPDKLLNIIELSEKVLGIEDREIEVEYQGETIGKYGLAYEDGRFRLTSKQTDCLAKEGCLPSTPKRGMMTLQTVDQGCTPGSGCC